MPGQELAQPNPPPDVSHIPDPILDFSVHLDTQNALTPQELKAVQTFRRAADYIAAGQYKSRIRVHGNILMFFGLSYNFSQGQYPTQTQNFS